jgi:pyruvate formate lyase activating enzyme
MRYRRRAAGFCRARRNEGGRVVDGSYGRITALALDPIEKKPLKRFMQGKMILSVGSYGCNLRCPFCQNSGISMDSGAEVRWTLGPQQLADKAEARAARGNVGVAYT